MQPMLYIFKYVDFSFIFYVKIFIEDTAAVVAAKQEFFAVFDAATKGLITTRGDFRGVARPPSQPPDERF